MDACLSTFLQSADRHLCHLSYHISSVIPVQMKTLDQYMSEVIRIKKYVNKKLLIVLSVTPTWKCIRQFNEKTSS